ncbi:MAG: site-specific integrase [Bacteroidales bacterium]|nr:site-specific integrase [Bacteroidales bacterium]
MKVTGSSIQQLDKVRKNGTPMPRSECRRWRLWATTEEGRKSRRFEGTYTQACEALRDFVSELEGFVPNSETFGAYADSWQRYRAESGCYSPNTVANEAMVVRALRRTALDGMRMDAIGPSECRDALLWLRGNPCRRGELKASTLAKVHQVLGAIMRQAEDDGKIASDPMRKVRAPKVRHVEQEALSPDELQLLLNRLDSMPLDGRVMAVYLMACLGLRCGEACALADSEIDARYATVTSTMRAADRSIGPAKTNAGMRTLPVPPRLAAKLAEWRAERARLGIQDAEALCCSKDGSRLSTGAVSGWWNGGKGYCGARERLGCPGITLHQLRHSNLSMMARHMSPFDLQRYAGWSSIAPAKVYVHGDMGAVARAVDAAWAM